MALQNSDAPQSSIVLLEVPAEIRDATGPIICELCGLSIQGIICSGPSMRQVHYGCALREECRLEAAWQKRHDRRRAQQMHKERWESLRPKRSPKRARATKPYPATSKPARKEPLPPEPTHTSCFGGCFGGVLASIWQLLPSTPLAPVTRSAQVASDAFQRFVAGAQQACAIQLAERAEYELVEGADAKPYASLSRFLVGAGSKICSFLLPFASWESQEDRGHTTRMIQKGSRGAHLSRMAAARRGALLMRWGLVRQRRREHTWQRSSCLRDALCKAFALAMQMAQVAQHIVAKVASACMPQLERQDKGDPPGFAAALRARRLAHAGANWALPGKSSWACLWHRCVHSVLFVAVLSFLHNLLPAWAALGAAYFLVHCAARRSAQAHRQGCRWATASTVAIGAGICLGALWSAFGAAIAFLIPSTWLWWPPSLRKRPASTLPGPVLKKPALAISSTLKRPAASGGNAAARPPRMLLRKRPALSERGGAAGKWDQILHRVSDWSAAHEGQLPKRTSQDPVEKALAKDFSYVPRTMRQAVLAKGRQHWFLKVARQYLEYLRAHGTTPKNTRGAPGAALCKRWERMQGDLEEGADTMPELRELLASIEAETPPDVQGWAVEERRRFRKPILEAEQQLRRNYRSWCAAHDQQVRPELPELQTSAAPGQAFAGRSPYPGFTNLASTCYMNAPLQCLFHCSCVRQALADKAEGRDGLCVTRLARLLRTFTEGLSLNESPSAAMVDIFAPHEFADFLRASRPAFVLGAQHDAADFLSWLLQHTSISHHCCGVGAVPRSDYGLVLAAEILAGSSVSALLEQEVTPMEPLVLATLGHDETMLREVPPLLLLRLPQCIHGGEDEEHRWIQAESPCQPKASWGTGVVDLRTCCSPQCANRAEAVYRIKGFVQYCRKPAVPSLAISSGHYAAFFREEEVWYHCDDLRNGALPVAMKEAPVEYPYICFFEQVGQRRISPPSLPPNPVTQCRSVAAADARDESISSTCGEDDGDGGEGEGHSDAEPPSKRPRKHETRNRKGRKQDRADRQQHQDRKGRKQDRADRQQNQERQGRKQDRAGRQHSQERKGRKQDRAGQQHSQERKGRGQDRKGRQQDRTGRLKQAETGIKRARTQGDRNDNTDASRKDIQADADNPVQDHAETVHLQQQAACCRRRFGIVYVLLHTLAHLTGRGVEWQPC